MGTLLRPPKRKRQACSSSTPYWACEHPVHTSLHFWVLDCQARVCLYCNPQVATARGRLIVSWLFEERQTLVLSLIAQGEEPHGPWSMEE